MTEIGDGLEVTTVLFGSFAKGQSDKERDVDLFVIRKKKPGASLNNAIGEVGKC